jgi:hypothetical protein
MSVGLEPPGDGSVFSWSSPCHHNQRGKKSLGRSTTAGTAPLTAMAKTGASPIAVMTTAAHASMQTTKKYLHLAGTVFPEEAARLEQRLGLSTALSTDLSESQAISDEVAPLQQAEQRPS